MSDDNQVDESINSPELHEEVTALDGKIAAAQKDELSDSEKEALNALVEERNEAYRRHHAAPQSA